MAIGGPEGSKRAKVMSFQSGKVILAGFWGQMLTPPVEAVSPFELRYLPYSLFLILCSKSQCLYCFCPYINLIDFSGRKSVRQEKEEGWRAERRKQKLKRTIVELCLYRQVWVLIPSSLCSLEDEQLFILFFNRNLDTYLCQLSPHVSL